MAQVKAKRLQLNSPQRRNFSLLTAALIPQVNFVPVSTFGFGTSLPTQRRPERHLTRRLSCCGLKTLPINPRRR